MTGGVASLRGILYCAATMGLMIVFSQSALAQKSIQLEGDVARGSVIAETCATCHGAGGMGYAEGIPRIVGQSAAYLRTQLLLFRRSAHFRHDDEHDHNKGEIAHLKSVARSFSGMDEIVMKLTDQDIADVASYYALQQCKPSGKPQPARPAISSRCDTCHGAGGKKASRNRPTLASQHAVYLRRQLKFFRAAKEMSDIDLAAEGATRYSRTMFTQARWLTDTQINDLARYYESIPCD